MFVFAGSTKGALSATIDLLVLIIQVNLRQQEDLNQHEVYFILKGACICWCET